MNILFVTHYYAPTSGAAATRLTRLAQALQRRGHRITVLTTMPHYPKGEIEPEFRGRRVVVKEAAGVRVVYTWLWATPSPRISRKLLSQLSFMLMATGRGAGIARPDVVFIEAQPMPTALAGRLIARLKRAPYVLNVSDLWPDHLLSVGALSEDSPVYRMARAVVDRGYRGAAAITAMSPAWAQAIAGYIDEPLGEHHKITTILRGVDTQQFRPLDDAAVSAFRQQHGLADKKWVSFIGTLATQYDFEMVMRVARHFDNREDVGFLVIGTGSQQAVIADHAPSHLRWIAWLPHEQIPAAWNASHCTLWAMRDEALYRGTIPAKLYEALACGTPIAAAQAGEAAAMIAQSGGGIAVPPDDAQALINALTRLLDDAQFHAQCQHRARAYALKHLDFDVTAQQYEAVLEQAVIDRR